MSERVSIERGGVEEFKEEMIERSNEEHENCCDRC